MAQKLAQILRVDEQELTDLPLKSTGNGASINPEVLSLVIENIENWLINRKATMSPHDKAELIRLIYMKIYNEPMDTALNKVRDFIDIYDEFKKVN